MIALLTLPKDTGMILKPYERYVLRLSKIQRKYKTLKLYCKIISYIPQLKHKPETRPKFRNEGIYYNESILYKAIDSLCVPCCYSFRGCEFSHWIQIFFVLEVR